MKYILVTLCISFSIFAKCKKDKWEGIYFGYAKAEINGVKVNFKASGGLLYNLADSISLVFQKLDGFVLKESISIQKIYKGTNLPQSIHKVDNSTIRVESLSSAYYMTDDDLICDIYDVYEPDSAQNYISITDFNSQTKEIKGIFQVTYLIDPAWRKCNPAAPDTIRIRNGVFHTKVF